MTKDQSGWRGPASALEVGPPPILKWQGRTVQVRTQDIRRALVCAVFLAQPTPDAATPLDILRSFADGLENQVVRLGWLRADAGWLRARASEQHSEVLVAALHVAACGLHLTGTVGCRIGRGVSVLEGVAECGAAFLPQGSYTQKMCVHTRNLRAHKKVACTQKNRYTQSPAHKNCACTQESCVHTRILRVHIIIVTTTMTIIIV